MKAAAADFCSRHPDAESNDAEAILITEILNDMAKAYPALVRNLMVFMSASTSTLHASLAAALELETDNPARFEALLLPAETS